MNNTPSNIPLLAVESLSKKFGGTTANDNITMQVNKGEIVGVIGPNGSGQKHFV